jgi:hypothetical protein
MTLVERLEKVDRRYLFLVILLAVFLPLLRPLGLPIEPTPKVIGLYKTIEALPEGSVVYFATDWDPGAAPELYPMAQATLRHLFRRNLKVICGTTWPTAGPLADNVLKEIATEAGKTYGVDYINLGFKEGREVVMVSIATDIANAYPIDYYGKPTTSYPIMADVKDFQDIALLLNISGGYPGTKEWLQQVQRRFGMKMASCTTAVSEPEYVPNFQAGQLVGLVGGLAGAAEYERLIEVPGTATRGMDAQSLGHVTIIALIIVSNIAFLVRKRSGK